MQDYSLPGAELDNVLDTFAKQIESVEDEHKQLQDKVELLAAAQAGLLRRIEEIENRKPQQHDFGGVGSTGEAREGMLGAEAARRAAVAAQHKAEPEPQRRWVWVIVWANTQIFTRIHGFISRRAVANDPKYETTFFEDDHSAEKIIQALHFDTMNVRKELTEVVERDGRMVEAHFAGAE